MDARGNPRSGFRVRVANGRTFHARRLLLATGVRDRIPPIPGIETFYGVSIHHCPFCDGWEWRDRRLAVYGRGAGGSSLAHSLLSWSADVVLLTDGPARLTARSASTLARRQVRVLTSRVTRLEGRSGRLRRIHFRDGAVLERDAMFLATGNAARTELAARLDCRFKRGGAIWTDHRECASMPGVYVAGDASHDVQFAIVAAAEGAKAAVAIHHELVGEDRANAVTSLRRREDYQREMERTSSIVKVRP